MPENFYNETHSDATGGAVFLSISHASVFFGPAAVIAMTGAGSTVLAAGIDTRAVISGSLFAADTTIAGGGDCSFTIADSGQVLGEHSFDLTGGGNVIANDGFIGGRVWLESSDNTILNTGTISTDGIGVQIGGGDSMISNSGSIVARGSALLVLPGAGRTGDQIVVNSGVIGSIKSDAIAMSALDGAAYIHNSGTISTGHGADHAIGTGAGADEITSTGTIIGDIDTAGGDDTVDTSRGTIQGAIYGGGGDDTLIGMDGGNDVLDGGAGGDLIDGGAGEDTVSYASGATGVTADLLDPTRNTGDAAGDTYVSVERIRGSAGADTLGGGDDANRISGNGGDDALSGRGGNDVLYGADGDDILDGGPGNDRLSGQTGTDTASYASAAKGVTVSLAIAAAQNTVGAGLDTLSSIENLAGSRLADHLTGDAGANRLAGGNGNDVLDGGSGNDVLAGGKDADTFVFSTDYRDSRDTIADYVVADDTIDLAKSIYSAFTATGTIGAGNLFVGNGPHDADDHLIYNATTGALFYDPDGTGSALSVQIASLHAHLALTAADFVVI